MISKPYVNLLARLPMVGTDKAFDVGNMLRCSILRGDAIELKWYCVWGAYQIFFYVVIFRG